MHMHSYISWKVIPQFEIFDPQLRCHDSTSTDRVESTWSLCTKAGLCRSIATNWCKSFQKAPVAAWSGFLLKTICILIIYRTFSTCFHTFLYLSLFSYVSVLIWLPNVCWQRGLGARVELVCTSREGYTTFGQDPYWEFAYEVAAVDLLGKI